MTLTDRLNSEEMKAFQELKDRMKGALPPTLCEDSTLFYRFLKARDFDVDKAEKMLVRNISWRKAFQIDTLLDDFKPREYFCKYTEPTLLDYGKDGEMIVYCATGKVETSDVMKCVTMNEYMKSWIWFTLRSIKLLNEQREKTGKECMQITFIVDLDKLTFSNTVDRRTADLWLQLVHLFQDNFPERMKAVYVINAPSYYVIIFNLLKVVMSGTMLQKIHVLGHGGYESKLLDLIDADKLPAFLGGNKTDPNGNPLCNTFVSHGGKILPSYYLSDEDRYFSSKSYIEKVTIPKRGKEEIHVDVTEKGSVIQLQFLVLSKKDIGVGLSLKDLEQKVKMILPIERYFTTDGTEMISYRCQITGKYAVIFDNSHSWMTSKELEYCVTVIKPEC